MTPEPVTLLETMRAEDGQVAWLDRHLARLSASSAVFGLVYDDAAVRDAVSTALVQPGLAYQPRHTPPPASPLPTGAGQGEGVPGQTVSTGHVQKLRLTLGPDGPAARASPLGGAPFRTVWLCPDPLLEAGGPLCRHKTTSRAHYETPFERARAAGADEALLINTAGELVEGSRTSLWVRRGGEWLTPPLAAGGLPGVARAVLLRALPRAREARLTPADLRGADALAVSNALRGLCPVRLAGEPPGRAAPLASLSPHVPMSGILDLLAQNLNGAPMGQIAQAIGADEATTRRAVGAALPALLTGLDRNTNAPGGAQALAGAVQRDHDGSLLDNLGGFLSQMQGGGQAPAAGGGIGGALGSMLGGAGGGGMLGGLLGGLMGGRSTDGGGILGHILGGQQPQVEQGVAQASGLNMGQVTKLLPILAPIVMAAIGKYMSGRNASPADLSGALTQEATVARHAAPTGAMGALTGFLDADGDGSITDDLMARAGQAGLGRLFGR